MMRRISLGICVLGLMIDGDPKLMTGCSLVVKVKVDAFGHSRELSTDPSYLIFYKIKLFIIIENIHIFDNAKVKFNIY